MAKRKRKKPVVYFDLHRLSETERIRQIGEAAMLGNTVSFITEDEDGKMERYLMRLFMEFPGLELVQRGKGPTEGAVWAKVRPKQ